MVYPNPNNGSFTIQSPVEGKYTIVNVMGQTVYTFNINAASISFSCCVNIKRKSIKK